MMNRLRLACAFLLLGVVSAISWSAPPLEIRHEHHFPDLPGYKTLACDLHMHTVFSDGGVWPTVRVNEAWRLGLDAIAITDHIEYQPHKDDVPTKHGRSYELAEGSARTHGLMLIRAAEFTRDTPPGHFNALFLNDVKPLDTPDFLDAIKLANQQGAFVFWNHHTWKGEEKGAWLDVHTTMYDNKWLHGMEVANGDDYYPQAHKWCLEKKLTMLGNSDIHDPDLRQKNTAADHRTTTLVLAKERSPAGLKDALIAGRTVVWCKDQLIGREDVLRPMFAACVQVGKPIVRSKTGLVVEVKNTCDADIRLERTGTVGPLDFVLPARTTALLKVSAPDTKKPIALEYEATTFRVAPDAGLPITLTIPGP